jgi:hypothetical protein
VGKSLLDVLRDVTLDPGEQAAFTADPAGYLAQYGYEDVQADDLSEAFSLVADTLPPEVAQAVSTGNGPLAGADQFGDSGNLGGDLGPGDLGGDGSQAFGAGFDTGVPDQPDLALAGDTDDSVVADETAIEDDADFGGSHDVGFGEGSDATYGADDIDGDGLDDAGPFDGDTTDDITGELTDDGMDDGADQAGGFSLTPEVDTSALDRVEDTDDVDDSFGDGGDGGFDAADLPDSVDDIDDIGSF